VLYFFVSEGISLDHAKKSNGADLIAGAAPMPREMSFPLGASECWSDVYDYIRYWLQIQSNVWQMFEWRLMCCTVICFVLLLSLVKSMM